MTALSDALAAAQAKALAALEKAYVRDAIGLDEFRERCEAIGCTDTVDRVTLIQALDVLKELGASEPAYTERRTTEPATEAQRSYIAKLCDERGFTAPDFAGTTKEQAGTMIDELKNGNYDPAKYDVPF